MPKDTCTDHFTVHNIPFGIATSSEHPEPQPVTRIHDTVLFLRDVAKSELFSGISILSLDSLNSTSLNSFAALPPHDQQSIRHAIQERYGEHGLDGFVRTARLHISQVTMHLPVQIGDFTDTSCSLAHVRNAGRVITGSEAIPPSFSFFPLAYQGRTASIVPSGTPVQRPRGHFIGPLPSGTEAGAADKTRVIYAPSGKVDYEVELAAVIGKPSVTRHTLSPKEAEEYVFGFVMLNDWSARDIQGFEMTPLGPFNGKSMGTSISPWIVTADALKPFRTPAARNDLPESYPLYQSPATTYTITLDVDVIADGQTTRTGRCSVSSLYWTPQQMIAHTTSSGSALRTGDLIATGTVSGDVPGSYGCLLEATSGGTEPLQLLNGSHRAFLNDGDVVRITGFAGQPDSGVGFGEVIGELVGCDVS